MHTNSHPRTRLTAAQEKVVAAVASGASLSQAAAETGVHRNTLGYWRRSFTPFAEALQEARYDNAMDVRDAAVTLADHALATVKDILDDHNAPASVRLKAALVILEKASTTPPEPPAVTAQPLHKNAQTAVPPQPKALTAAGQMTAVQTLSAQTLHKDAQTVSLEAPAASSPNAPKIC